MVFVLAMALGWLFPFLFSDFEFIWFRNVVLRQLLIIKNGESYFVLINRGFDVNSMEQVPLNRAGHDVSPYHYSGMTSMFISQNSYLLQNYQFLDLP